MSAFGEINFQEVSEQYGEGMYDGRKFTIIIGDDESTVEGNFTDEERAFIFTQWEIHFSKSMIEHLKQLAAKASKPWIPWTAEDDAEYKALLNETGIHIGIDGKLYR